jgi:hypothetical protein
MKEDIPRLESYLRRLLKRPQLRVAMVPKKTDMAEVYDGEEFIAPLYREEEDGEVSYQLQLVILGEDLEEAR